METESKAETPAEAIARLGLVMRAQFVPHSQSRSKGEKPCLNWRVAIGRPAVCPHGAPGCACVDGKLSPGAIETDYSQGIGHIPGYKFNARPSVDDAEAIRRTCESGRIFNARFLPVNLLPPPALIDVLYSLVMDAAALDYPRFERWAEDVGENIDSRRAEGIYRDCLRLGLELRALMGEAGLASLRTAYEGF